MENSKISLQDAFNNKKLFSHKIHDRVLEVLKEISINIRKFKIANNEDKQMFLNAVNFYCRDLCAVIFQLRRVVINIDADDKNICDLQNVITQLNKIVFSIQESLNLERENLKVQLEAALIDVGPQVEKLMKIIERENLNEYKQKILDYQLDLLISAEALKLFIQDEHISFAVIGAICHGVIEKIRNNLIAIDTVHGVLLEDFLHYIRHCVQNLQNHVDYLLKMNNTEHFQNDMANALKAIGVICIEFMRDILEALHYDNPVKKMLDTIDNCQKNLAQCVVEIQKGFQSAALENVENKDDQRVKGLINYVFVNGLNGMSVMNLCIEDAILKK